MFECNQNGFLVSFNVNKETFPVCFGIHKVCVFLNLYWLQVMWPFIVITSRYESSSHNAGSREALYPGLHQLPKNRDYIISGQFWSEVRITFSSLSHINIAIYFTKLFWQFVNLVILINILLFSVHNIFVRPLVQYIVPDGGPWVTNT